MNSDNYNMYNSYYRIYQPNYRNSEPQPNNEEIITLNQAINLKKYYKKYQR